MDAWPQIGLNGPANSLVYVDDNISIATYEFVTSMQRINTAIILLYAIGKGRLEKDEEIGFYQTSILILSLQQSLL